MDDKLKDHLQRISKFATFKLELLQDKITEQERFDIADFKVKYLILQITNFKDVDLLDELLALGDNILDFNEPSK